MSAAFWWMKGKQKLWPSFNWNVALTLRNHSKRLTIKKQFYLFCCLTHGCPVESVRVHVIVPLLVLLIQAKITACKLRAGSRELRSKMMKKNPKNFPFDVNWKGTKSSRYGASHVVQVGLNSWLWNSFDSSFVCRGILVHTFCSIISISGAEVFVMTVYSSPKQRLSLQIRTLCVRGGN